MSKQEEREMYVVKSNDLIRRSRYNLTTQQQKIVLYCIRMIKPTDREGQKYTVSIRELCEVCGLDMDVSGAYYTRIKEDFKKLMTREFLKIGTHEKSISWIGDVDINEGNSTIQFSFNANLTQDLFELRRNYTQYKLVEVLLFDSKYSIRIYELLKSYSRSVYLDNNIEQNFDIYVSDLRNMLEIGDKYKLFKEFKRNILQVAVDEINKKSGDMHIEYETIKNGKTIERINFILTLPDIQQTRRADKLRRDKLK